jgi:ATP-dependent protease ClpP protease subunit
MQALVLAAGTDKRLLLPNALVEIGDLSAHEVGFKKAISLSGTLQEVPSGAQLHFERLLKRLNLCQELFLVQQTLSAEGAVKHGFADAVYQATRSRGLNSEPPYEYAK